MSGNKQKPSDQSAQQGRKPEPSMGPDEEGEVPLEPDQIPPKDSGAWVKRRSGDEEKKEKPRPG